jgi:hypothetical protein
MAILESERQEKRDRVVVAAGAAVLVAGLTLVAFVLPAEYGVDPLGTGRALGLLELGKTGQQIEALAVASASRSEAGNPSVILAQDRGFQAETREFTVGPREGMEYKYRLEKGEALHFSWSATGRVDYEFHAEPDGAPRGYAETYEKGQSAERASGTLTAPFSGIHGWYWENREDRAMTVTLNAAGFFNLSHEYRKNQPVKNKTFD